MRQRILTVMAMAMLALGWTSAFAGPVVEFEKTTFDLGKPMEGEKVKASFAFKNTGDAELEITRVQAGCGCTDARATETKVQPGKSAAVEAVFNTTGYRSQVSKTVTVTTNDPAHATVTLTITADVLPIAEIKPQPYLNLGDVKPGSIHLSDFVVAPNVKQQFRILRVESTRKSVSSLVFDRKPNRAGNYALKIRVIASHNLGRFYETVSIITDLPGNTAIRFPVYGNVVADAPKENKGS